MISDDITWFPPGFVNEGLMRSNDTRPTESMLLHCALVYPFHSLAQCNYKRYSPPSPALSAALSSKAFDKVPPTALRTTGSSGSSRSASPAPTY
eukprot:SAG22_NODE_543_length_9289_cov_43.919151_3_plen_94_part_00